MRTPVVQTSCDFCGYGGALSAPRDFQTFKAYDPGAGAVVDVDLCVWCAKPGDYAATETGGHLVTFTDYGWSCSCGETSRDWPTLQLRLSRPLHVVAAIPNLHNATAHVHLDNIWRR